MHSSDSSRYKDVELLIFHLIVSQAYRIHLHVLILVGPLNKTNALIPYWVSIYLQRGERFAAAHPTYLIPSRY